MNFPSGRRRAGLTLMELLAVISITTILVSLFLMNAPALLEAGRTTKCVSNLHQIHVGLMLYISDHNGAFIPEASIGSGPPGPSINGVPCWPFFWYNALDPYMGCDNDDPNSANRPAWQLCPSKINNPMSYYTVGYGWNYTSFGLSSDDSPSDATMYGDNSRLSQVTKPAHTIIVGDSKDAATMPGSDYDYQNIYIYSWPTNPCRATRHRGGGNYLFLDGHIELLTAAQLNADPTVWQKTQ